MVNEVNSQLAIPWFPLLLCPSKVTPAKKGSVSILDTSLELSLMSELCVSNMQLIVV